MQTAWYVMILCAILYGMVVNPSVSLSSVLLESAAKSVQLAIRLAGSCAFFCGLMKMAEQAGAMKWLIKRMQPLLDFLFPKVTNESARTAIAENFAANLLGLGNAATPAGIRAAAELAGGDKVMPDALCMFLVVNTSSLQLLPSTVIALRSAAGAASPADILLPTFLATAASTLAGIACCIFMRKRSRGTGHA